jgi:hypothetical protein
VRVRWSLGIVYKFGVDLMLEFKPWTPNPSQGLSHAARAALPRKHRVEMATIRQPAAFPVPTSSSNCLRTVRHFSCINIVPLHYSLRHVFSLVLVDNSLGVLDAACMRGDVGSGLKLYVIGKVGSCNVQRWRPGGGPRCVENFMPKSKWKMNKRQI